VSLYGKILAKDWLEKAFSMADTCVTMSIINFLLGVILTKIKI